MNEKTKELLELVKQNPNLPIVPMVDSEVVADESYSCWLGSFRGVSIDEYVSVEIYGDNVFFTRDNQDEIEEHFANQIANEIDEDISDEEIDKRAHEWAESLPWTKAIIVWVGLPEA